MLPWCLNNSSIGEKKERPPLALAPLQMTPITRGKRIFLGTASNNVTSGYGQRS